MDVAEWLQDLGLPDYAALFREQAIDADVLPSLTDADFEKLGLPLGHRRKLLTAIAAPAGCAVVHRLIAAAVPRGTPPAHGDVRRPRWIDVPFHAARS